MAITKINTPELLDINTTGAKQLPSGTTAQRPTTGLTAGDFRYNTTDNRVEYYDGTSPYDAAKWFQIDDEALPATCTTDTINYPTGTTNTAYYKMSDATDSTLNGYNGTATNVDFNVQGKFGNAGEFNGSSSGITSSSLGTALNVSSLSFSLWFKTNLNDSTDRILISSYDGSGNARFYASLLNSGLSVVIYGSSSTYIQNFINTVTTGTWYHLSVTHTGTTTTVYLNGTAITPSSTTGSPVAIKIAGSPQPLTMGQLQGSVGTYDFNGSIDQVRIFSTALTAANVTSLYNEVQCVPAIIPSDYFNPLLYTGNGSTQSIDDLTFAPDFVWIKDRTTAEWHALVDSVRGSSQLLSSNSANAENSNSDVTSFDSNGFSLTNTNNFVNRNNDNYVAWNWKAAATTTTIAANTVGNTIASDVRANTDAGFSIVSYAGNSASSATIGHGLDSAPEMVIIKARNFGAGWPTLGVPGGNFTYCRRLNDTAVDNPSGYYSAFFNSTLPTSSVFSVGNSDEVNDGYNYIAYCFASIPGFSDIGSYIGTGGSNSIVTGFRPAFVMVKASSDPSSWYIVDNKRTPNNFLSPDLPAAEYTDAGKVIFNSNGFSFTSTSYNNSGYTWIYMAIAEEVYNANGVTANQTNPFNDGSQIAQYEFEDNADDSQPNGYIGKGGTFNGSSSVITSSSAGTAINVSNLSFSLWLNTNNTSTTHKVFLSQYDESGNSRFYFSLKDSGIVVVIYSATGGYVQNFPNIISTNQWYHVAITHTGTVTKLYLDGQLQTASSSTGSPIAIRIASSPQDLYFGQLQGYGGTFPFNGEIDQVRIYNTALNPNDVWLLYSETSATSSTLDYPASTGAIALYELEGDATSTSSSTYNGAATAVAWVPLYDGTPTSMTYAAPSVSAPFLKAASFSGSNYITTPTLPDYRSGFGFSSWVLSDTTNNKFILTQRTTGGYANFAYRLTSGKVSLLTGNGTSAYYIFYTAPTALTDGWHHIVVTGTSTTIKIYVDGSLLTTQTGTAFTNSSNMGHVMGVNYYNGNYDYVGAGSYSLDQFRIFNKALDSGEVLQLYNEPNN